MSWRSFIIYYKFNTENIASRYVKYIALLLLREA